MNPSSKLWNWLMTMPWPGGGKSQLAIVSAQPSLQGWLRTPTEGRDTHVGHVLCTQCGICVGEN